jgi:hypothetical protein
MTVANVSAGDQYTVFPIEERLKQEAVIHSPGAHYTDQVDICRILHTGHPCQVSPGIRAPVANES